jgi:drug/metabolite transporter (DMT)-like permease
MPGRSLWRLAGFFCAGCAALSDSSRQAKVAGLLFGNAARLPTSASQWWVLAWLGMVASGLGLYWRNKGASLVDGGTLAVMNNALVAAGLLVNLLLYNRDADLWRLAWVRR